MGLVDLGHEADPVLTRIVEEDKERSLSNIFTSLLTVSSGIMVQEEKPAIFIPIAISNVHGYRDYFWFRFTNDQWSTIHPKMESMLVLQSHLLDSF